MAGTTEPLAEKPKTFDTVGDLPAMPKLNEGASKLTGASKAEFEKALGVYQPFLTAQEGMVKGLGRAESDILQSEQEQKRIQATGTSAAAQKQIADIEKGQRDLDEAMQKEPIPKFVPTKETADDLVVFEENPGIGFRTFSQSFGSAFKQLEAAFFSTLRTQVDHPVGYFNYFRVVFDHKNSMSSRNK